MLEEIDLNNLHHAYLIVGKRGKLREEIQKFLKLLKNFELVEITTDTFKIEDARNLKSLSAEKSFTGKKIIIVSANSILLDAQNTLLKLFEEPIPDTHFFVLVPDVGALLKTLVSRFYIITPRQGLGTEQEIENFLALPAASRLDFIKEKLAKFEDEELVTDSARAEALRFINSLESALHNNMSRLNLDIECLDHIFQVRKNLRMPGSSVKQLLESVALTIPVIQ